MPVASLRGGIGAVLYGMVGSFKIKDEFEVFSQKPSGVLCRYSRGVPNELRGLSSIR